MLLQTLQKRYVRVYRKKCKIAKCEEDKDATPSFAAISVIFSFNSSNSVTIHLLFSGGGNIMIASATIPTKFLASPSTSLLASLQLDDTLSYLFCKFSPLISLFFVGIQSKVW